MTAVAQRLRHLVVRLHVRNGIARFGTQIAGDALAWILSVPLACWLRYELATDHLDWPWLAVVIATVLVAQLCCGLAFSLYRGRYGFGSAEEVISAFLTVCAVTLVVGLPLVVVGPLGTVPRTTMVIAAPMAFVLMAGLRYAIRLLLESGHRPGDQASPTLILGAGFLGTQLVRHFRNDPDSELRPIGLVDDQPRLRGAIRGGLKVLGSRVDLPALVGATGATHLVVAIARADADLLAAVDAQCRDLGLRVYVVPRLTELVRGLVHPARLQPLSIEDILGRRTIDTDVNAVAGYVQGKRVLITGAGGSIGSELCKQVAGWFPAELIMLDRDESALQAVQLAIHGHGLLNTRDVVLGDIRDESAIARIFADRRPQVVFHAAALKHLPMLEQFPDEAWKTNVLGTRNVLRAARNVRVETFVNISTDKAANPTSVLGHSKHLAEQLTASIAGRATGRYISVRFGNVLGSRGSMVPVFQTLIEAGGPLTVTHPDITRYFMSIPEACQLVVQAGAIGRPGEVLVLDMGAPVRILDIAQRMIERSGKRIDIVFTGLRPHEKLHEDLIGDDEGWERPFHPLISHVHAQPLAASGLSKSAWDRLWIDQESPATARVPSLSGSAMAAAGGPVGRASPVRP